MVRRATTSDVDELMTLMKTVPGFWQPWWCDKTVEHAITSAGKLSFVWESKSEILGFVCAHNLGFRAYLSELIVNPSASHRGIGTLLVRAVEEALRKEGQRILIADVWREAESFRSLGWKSPDVVLLRQKLATER
jgi:ribosomal protein S18 acetylase RimI-like enzyme